MKKSFLPVLVAATLFIPFALSGCGSSDEDNAPTEEMHQGDDHDYHGHQH